MEAPPRPAARAELTRAAAETGASRGAAAASPSLVEAAEAIADPDLRARFLESAALYLDRAVVPKADPGAMSEAVILSAVRLPTGKFLGALKGFTAPQLGALVVREAVAPRRRRPRRRSTR